MATWSHRKPLIHFHAHIHQQYQDGKQLSSTKPLASTPECVYLSYSMGSQQWRDTVLSGAKLVIRLHALSRYCVLRS